MAAKWVWPAAVVMEAAVDSVPTVNRRRPHWLLRFFDFSVEPGKKYKYRVQLVMLDPNYSVGLEDLAGDVIIARTGGEEGQEVVHPGRLEQAQPPGEHSAGRLGLRGRRQAALRSRQR